MRLYPPEMLPWGEDDGLPGSIGIALVTEATSAAELPEAAFEGPRQADSGIQILICCRRGVLQSCGFELLVRKCKQSLQTAALIKLGPQEYDILSLPRHAKLPQSKLNFGQMPSTQRAWMQCGGQVQGLCAMPLQIK